MSETPTEELTMPGRMVRKTAGRKTAPAWLTYVVIYLFVKVELLFMTDGEQRTEWVADIPAGVAWVADNGTTIMAAVGVLIAAYQLILRQRAA